MIADAVKSPYQLEQARQLRDAHAYAKAHNIRGASGGWIYLVQPRRDGNGDTWTPLTQGWMSFFNRNRVRIEAWTRARDEGIAHDDAERRRHFRLRAP